MNNENKRGNRFYILILLAIVLYSFSDCYSNNQHLTDSVIITGKMIDGQNCQIIEFGIIEINGISFKTKQSGEFYIKISKTDFELQFKSVGYRPLSISNIPFDLKAIDLGNVPMFKDSGILINYTCRSWQFICKYRRNRYLKGVDRHTREERLRSNKIIDKYRYEFQEKEYSVKTSIRNDELTIEL